MGLGDTQTLIHLLGISYSTTLPLLRLAFCMHKANLNLTLNKPQVEVSLPLCPSKPT